MATNQSSQVDATWARYSRQMLFAEFGREGQEKLAGSRVLLVGCGALGTVLADTLVRAGVGFLRIVDRDYVELNNLQRQILFTEQDVTEGSPKAVAAAERLSKINSTVKIEPVVADAHSGNVENYADEIHLLLDGTDNFETRFLINDVAVKHAIPWVYGACVGSIGMVMPILPGVTPCLRCVWGEPPPPGISPTCDTAGVLAPIVHIVASLQSVEAMKILTGKNDLVSRKLVQVDVWSGKFDAFDMSGARDGGDCRCCKGGRYDFLASSVAGRTASLCGRDAVQIAATGSAVVDFEQIARRLAAVAKSPPNFNRYLLRFKVDAYEITLFRDGRAIIKGTSDIEEGRTVYARYIGS
ncbi:MAG TPA: ThiF family adenylyltransferase [Phycisphaerae bacterium]|nr:ThiF family adenylyltransferase [Phycisphaerae bacterium]